MPDYATAPAPRRGRGRRPSAQVRQEILAAAGTILLSDGMAAFTVERVARLSGASKMTIYKWWPSKGALALDGYAAAVSDVLAFPDTGDIAADLTTQLCAFVRLMVDSPAGHVVPELIGQLQTDPHLAEAYREQYSRPRRALAIQALHRARDRGQIRPDVEPDVVVDQLWGACYHRLLVRDAELSEEFATQLVRNLVGGIAPSPGERQSPQA